jgi:hypothetical protein
MYANPLEEYLSVSRKEEDYLNIRLNTNEIVGAFPLATTSRAESS